MTPPWTKHIMQIYFGILNKETLCLRVGRQTAPTFLSNTLRIFAQYFSLLTFHTHTTAVSLLIQLVFRFAGASMMLGLNSNLSYINEVHLTLADGIAKTLLLTLKSPMQ